MHKRYHNYSLLALLFLVAAAYQIRQSLEAIDELRFATARPREPFDFGFRMRDALGITPEATQAGLKRFDTVLAIEGVPFKGRVVRDQALARHRPGDLLPVFIRRPDSSEAHVLVKLQPEETSPPGFGKWLVMAIIKIALPLFCIGLGFWVALIRPMDPLAWLLLAVLLSFAVSGSDWSSIALWIFLFGIYFPERAGFDRKHSWLKWVLIVPLALTWVGVWIFSWGRQHDFDAIRFIYPFVGFLYYALLALSIIAIGCFFIFLGWKERSASTPDVRRRLRVLLTGACFSLAPMMAVVITTLVRDRDLFSGLPEWTVVATYLALALFPVTLAYVIVVQRAMDVRMAVRQGAQYALARGGVSVLRAVMFVLALLAIRDAFAPNARNVDRVRASGIAATLFVLRRKYSDRLGEVLDRRFFREAYDSDRILSELSEEARNFVEAKPLLDRVTLRICETLHVQRAAVLLKNLDRYCVLQAVGTESAVTCLPQGAKAIIQLRKENRPALVYFDDPQSWVQQADASERDKLRELNAQLLLPLAGRDQLLGVMVLGPKLSEAPYSRNDLQLLQSVATQTGLALENSQLAATLVAEAAQRERANREMEIAREVQQRLFPQSYPPIAGIEYCGYCRPALGVGGDYYDFLPTVTGKLGIAIGDISGKGIAAALLMASLQASLRGQIMAGISDLGELMGHVNRLVFEASTSNRYATFFYGEYDSETRMLHFVNAGHNAPVVLRGGEVFRLEDGGPVIGLLKQASYTQASFQLSPGDLFVGYT
ncbi:MAG: SpoIIE family protein phosphatase, partial [Acidobacteriota bacterium]|nr:SpoIIE family protein phosphatase [Acidobacteriota bacterium]